MQTDLYALGLVLYEMVTGNARFVADGLEELRALHRSAAPASVSELAPEIAPEFEAVILEAMQEDPRGRPASAREMARALDGIGEDGGKSAPNPCGPRPMAIDPATKVSAILEELSREAADTAPRALPEELLPLVYEELRRLAGSYLRRERPGHTLQATALVHEAYERLVDQSRVSWRGRTHFFAVGAGMMRRLLVDHARHRGRQKRGGNELRVTLEGLADTPASNLDVDELLALDEALERLAELDAREARVVELRYFGGMDTGEIANALSVSERTVRGDWAHARAWLKKELTSSATW